MAQSSTKRTTTASNGGVLLLLLLLISATSKLTTAQTSDGDCSVLFAECFATDLCEACLTSIEGVGVDAVTTTGSEVGCTDYEFDEESVCDLLGVSYCCSAEFSGEDCFTDGATLDYWECLLGLNGCDTQDMPCISALTATESDADLTTSDRDIDGDASNSDAETAEDNGVPMGRGGGGSFVGQAAGALGLVVSVAAMLV